MTVTVRTDAVRIVRLRLALLFIAAKQLDSRHILRADTFRFAYRCVDRAREQQAHKDEQ